jgi:hypothetical protein
LAAMITLPREQKSSTKQADKSEGKKVITTQNESSPHSIDILLISASLISTNNFTMRLVLPDKAAWRGDPIEPLR